MRRATRQLMIQCHFPFLGDDVPFLAEPHSRATWHLLAFACMTESLFVRVGDHKLLVASHHDDDDPESLFTIEGGLCVSAGWEEELGEGYGEA